MRRVVPDENWQEKERIKRNALSICPYANSHKCPRYYDSIVLLSNINMIAGMTNDKKNELGDFWKKTSFSSLCDEEVATVYPKEFGGLSGVSNFCPEVSYKYLKYYSDLIESYADEIDKDIGVGVAERDQIDNDWKFQYRFVNPKFYLDCEIYESVKFFNDNQANSFLNSLHPNIIQLIARMDNCLDQGDPAGALHAASNILETMAKEITQNPKVAKEPLGGFISQFRNRSNLPENLKDAVLEIYNLRSRLDIAAHGGLNKPQLTMFEAISIAAMTKAILEIEYRSKANIET